jgi:uncharacterized protein involved in cysteine biosynthesis
MSEIKGQLLGILLVIMVFASVGTILASVFVNAANNVAEKVEDSNIIKVPSVSAKLRYN